MHVTCMYRSTGPYVALVCHHPLQCTYLSMIRQMFESILPHSVTCQNASYTKIITTSTLEIVIIQNLHYSICLGNYHHLLHNISASMHKYIHCTCTHKCTNTNTHLGCTRCMVEYTPINNQRHTNDLFALSSSGYLSSTHMLILHNQIFRQLTIIQAIAHTHTYSCTHQLGHFPIQANTQAELDRYDVIQHKHHLSLSQGELGDHRYPQHLLPIPPSNQ